MLDLYNNQQSYNGLGEFLRETTINLNWSTDWFSLSKNSSGNYWLIHIDGKLFYLLPIKDKPHNDGEFSKFFHQSSFNPDYKLINTPILEHSVGDSFKVYKKGDIAPRSTTDSHNAREQPTPQSKDDLLTELPQPKAIEYDRSQGKTVSVSAEIQELISEFERIRVADNTNILSRISQLESKIDCITDSFSAILQQSAAQVSAPVLTVTSADTTLTPEIQHILHLYHHRYKDLENSSIGGSQDPDNYRKRLSGTNIPVILVRNPNNKFLIVDDRYLVPKSGLNITTIIKQTIDDIFECQSFYASTSFKVVQPAIVDRIQGDRWQVTQKGVLQFD